MLCRIAIKDAFRQIFVDSFRAAKVDKCLTSMSSCTFSCYLGGVAAPVVEILYPRRSSLPPASLALTGRQCRSFQTANMCLVPVVMPATVSLCGFTMTIVFWPRYISFKTGTNCDDLGPHDPRHSPRWKRIRSWDEVHVWGY